MLNRKFCSGVFISLFFLSFFLMISPVTLASNHIPTTVKKGRYILWDDNYWYVTNKTVQQLLDEGFEVGGEPNKLLHVNYTRLNYTFKGEIINIDWPNITIQCTEGGYDLKVTIYEIFENNSIGNEINSFLSENLSSRSGARYIMCDPCLGIGFNNSLLWNGNTFNCNGHEYNVSGPDTLINIPWGQNQTYLVSSKGTSNGHMFEWKYWCDAESGLSLKSIYHNINSSFIQHEEQLIIETGIESGNRYIPGFTWTFIIFILSVIVYVIFELKRKYSIFIK